MASFNNTGKMSILRCTLLKMYTIFEIRSYAFEYGNLAKHGFLAKMTLGFGSQ